MVLQLADKIIFGDYSWDDATKQWTYDSQLLVMCHYETTDCGWSLSRPIYLGRCCALGATAERLARNSFSIPRAGFLPNDDSDSESDNDEDDDDADDMELELDNPGTPGGGKCYSCPNVPCFAGRQGSERQLLAFKYDFLSPPSQLTYTHNNRIVVRWHPYDGKTGNLATCETSMREIDVSYLTNNNYEAARKELLDMMTRDPWPATKLRNTPSGWDTSALPNPLTSVPTALRIDKVACTGARTTSTPYPPRIFPLLSPLFARSAR